MCDDSVDLKKRKFLLATSSFLGAVGAFFATIPFISAWFPSAKAQAQGAPVTIDIGKIEPGNLMIVQWRSKPVWILRRTPEMINNLSEHNPLLRDPDSIVLQQPDYAKNNIRSRREDLLVLVGICTHLGCIPKYKPTLGDIGPNWPGGFYCPCHGSKFDLAGRVYKGVPAPINMQVPPYSFLDDNHIIIGVDKNNKA